MQYTSHSRLRGKAARGPRVWRNSDVRKTHFPSHAGPRSALISVSIALSHILRQDIIMHIALSWVYSSLKRPDWHVLTRDHTVLPATRTLKHEWNEPSYLWFPAAPHSILPRFRGEKNIKTLKLLKRSIIYQCLNGEPEMGDCLRMHMRWVGVTLLQRWSLGRGLEEIAFLYTFYSILWSIGCDIESLKRRWGLSRLYPLTDYITLCRPMSKYRKSPYKRRVPTNEFDRHSRQELIGRWDSECERFTTTSYMWDGAYAH